MKIMPGGVDVSDLVGSEGEILPSLQTRMHRLEAQQKDMMQLMHEMHTFQREMLGKLQGNSGNANT